MKFTDGMWRRKEGVTVDWMVHAERVRLYDNHAELILAQEQEHRGSVVNTTTLSARLTSLGEGIIAAKFVHWAGEHDQGPAFDLYPSKAEVQWDHDVGSSLLMKSGVLNLEVTTTRNELMFSYSSEATSHRPSTRLTGHCPKSIAFVSDTNTGKYDPSDGLYCRRDHYILLGLDLAVHEKIYGLGERFGPFVKNGQSVDIWNEDGGTATQLAYKNIPFFMSSRGYGVFINHPGKVMLEIQTERNARINIVVQGEELEYMVIAGPTPKDVLNRYTALTGRPGLPPAWSYGLWLTTSFTTSYDENTVTSFLDGFKDRQIPLTTFHFDSYWMQSFQWCDFQFDDAVLSDAAGYLRRLRERGIKVSIWINPYIAQASALFEEGKKKGYFLMCNNTCRPTVWQTDLWQPGMAIVDFTNIEACRWYSSHLNRLMETGVDTFKTDFGERIPFDPAQVKFHNNCDPRKMHNIYSYLYNKTVYETMQSAGKDPCLFSRAATVGGQKFPVHWGGDCESTFEAMAETLRGGLSLSLSGFAFWAHDIGGFDGKPAPALYKRWVQFGLLSSHSRLHGSSSYRVPWIYQEDGEDEKCSKVLKDCVRLKLSLMPYLLRLALEANETGSPLLRATFLEFPDDPTAYYLDTQYMLGPNLLVAPVFSADGEVTFYVPISGVKNGAKWRSWFNHERTYEEGRWYTETHDFDTLPLLVRPATVTPFNSQLQRPDEAFNEGLEALVNGPLAADILVELVEAGTENTIAKTIKLCKNLAIQGTSQIQLRKMNGT